MKKEQQELNKQQVEELRERLARGKKDTIVEQLKFDDRIISITISEAQYLADLIEASEQRGESELYISQLEDEVGELIAEKILDKDEEKVDRRPWYEKHIERNEAIINDLKNRIKENKPPSPELDAGEVETSAGLKKEYRDELLDEESCEYVESNFYEEKIKVQHKIAKAYFDGAFKMRDNVLFDVENHIEKPLKKQIEVLSHHKKQWDAEKAELEKAINKLLPMADDAIKWYVQKGNHQEFIKDDRDDVRKIRELLSKHNKTKTP